MKDPDHSPPLQAGSDGGKKFICSPTKKSYFLVGIEKSVNTDCPKIEKRSDRS